MPPQLPAFSRRSPGHYCVSMSRSSTPDALGVTFGNITVGNVQQLRKMNASIFPVRYHDSFYADVPDGNPDFNQFGERDRDRQNQTRGQGETRHRGTEHQSYCSIRASSFSLVHTLYVVLMLYVILTNICLCPFSRPSTQRMSMDRLLGPCAVG